MDLQGLYGEYKPQGLVGGMVSGLNTGANLGQLFSNTRSTNQQTDAREQRLPLELAQDSANLDKSLMANDATRAVQTPDILAAKGSNALSNEQFQSMDIKRKMELLPFEKAIQAMDQVDQGQIKFASTVANALAQGSEDQVYQQMKGMLSPEQDAQIAKVLQDIKKNPKLRQQYAKQMADMAQKMTDTRDRADMKMWQERYLQMMRGQQGYSEASMRASKETPENKDIWMIRQLAAEIRQANKGLTNEQVMAKAVEKFKSQEQNMLVDGQSVGITGRKSLQGTQPTPATPSVGGWVKGPDGVMRKQ